MSLNFSYEMVNAVVLVVVVTGESVGAGAVTPAGTVQAPSFGLNQPIGGHGAVVQGRATGKANFEFDLFPQGVSQGTLYVVVVPPSNTALASAKLDDLSFELDTWTNDLWPATTFAGAGPDGGNVQGHAFTVNPNFSARQLSDPECRAIDNGRHKANVCEDWQVLVHSPGDDAATFDVADRATGASVLADLRATGGSYADPRRGTHDFSHALAFATSTVAGFQAGLTVDNRFRTNGRFWEQLVLPTGFVRLHPGPLQVRIVDNEIGRQSPLLPHSLGGVPVAPYVSFLDANAFLRL
jgi:hypothetical protein